MTFSLRYERSVLVSCSNAHLKIPRVAQLDQLAKGRDLFCPAGVFCRRQFAGVLVRFLRNKSVSRTVTSFRCSLLNVMAEILDTNES